LPLVLLRQMLLLLAVDHLLQSLAPPVLLPLLLGS
jgi:hypothetical protein